MAKIYVLEETLKANCRQSKDRPYRLAVFYSFEDAIKALHLGVNQILTSGLTPELIVHRAGLITVRSKESILTYADGSVSISVHMYFALHELETDLETGYICYTFPCCNWNYLHLWKVSASREEAVLPIVEYSKRGSGCKLYEDGDFYQVWTGNHVQIAAQLVSFDKKSLNNK